MRNLHGGLNITERVGSDHAAKQCHIQRDRTNIRALNSILQVFGLQCLYIFHRRTVLNHLMDSIRNCLNVLRCIEDDLRSITAIFILFALFVSKPADFLEYRVDVLLTDTKLGQFLGYQLGKLPGTDAQMFRANGLGKQRRYPPAPLQALAGYTAAGGSAKHTGLRCAGLVPVQIDWRIVFQHMNFV